MTKDEKLRDEVIDELDKMFQEHDLDWEKFFKVLSDQFKEFATQAQEESKIVSSCYESIAESLSEASFNFYVSTK